MNRVRPFGIVLVLVAVACGPHAASPEAGRDVVVDAFAALGRRDCAALRGLMPRLEDDEACNDYIEDSQAHGLSLLEVVETQNDGRDPHSVIVRCRVMMEGAERDMLVRATEDEHGWAVSM